MLEVVVHHAVVHLVRDDEHVLLDTDLGELLEFSAGEDLADGVVGGVDDDRLGLVRERCSELVDVERPVCARLDALGVRWWVEGHEHGFSALEGDTGVILVKVGFDEDDLVSWLEEGGECSEHAWSQYSPAPSVRKQNRLKGDSPQLAPAVTTISSGVRGLPRLTMFSYCGE